MGINSNIQTVELQLSKTGSRRIEESDYSKRKRDPELWNQARQGDIKLEDLFKQAEELAKEQAKWETRNDPAKKKYVAIHGNCVGVSGQAGIGKTTLTQQLVEKALNKELHDIEYLFYVSLKKVNYEEKLNVLQFLLTNLDFSWEHDPDSDKVLLEQLEKNGKVIIIFDGLDEAPIELKKQCPNAKLYDVTTPEVLLKNILNGNILRKAKKMITSRPRQMLELNEQYRPHCIVDVLGINIEAQRQICKNICTEDCETVLHELINHPELLAQCFVPIICIFTIYWLHQKHVQLDQTPLFPSVTNIILNVLETFILHGIAKNEFELKKLSKLAWDGLRHKRYEFTEKDINKSKLKKESLNTVLTTNTQISIFYVAKITYFSHLILQEFFSAAYLISFLPLCDFKDVLSVNDERFGNLDVVKTFLFGLCNASTYERLTNLQSTLYPDHSDFDEKKLFLEGFVGKITEDLLSYKLFEYLKVCSLLYEMQDRELTKKVVDRFPDLLDIDQDNIFPHEVGCLFYVLQERDKLLEIRIMNPTFVGDSRERFMSKMAEMPECIQVSIDKLTLTMLGILIIANSKCFKSNIIGDTICDIIWGRPQSQPRGHKKAFRPIKLFFI